MTTYNRGAVAKTKYKGIYSRLLADGTTVYDVIASVGGKQRQSRGHRTITLARDALEDLRRDMRKGVRGAASPRLTLAAFLTNDWLPYAERQLKSQESLRSYRRSVRQLVELARPTPPKSYAREQREYLLADLTARDLIAIQEKLAASLGPTSAAQASSRLRQALGHAFQIELIDRNPADRIASLTAPQREAPVLPLELLIEILAAADRTAYGTLVYLTMLTGLRWGEVSGLLWSDVDFAASVLRVRRTTTKSSAGTRAIWMGTETLARLQAHRLEQMRRFEGLKAPMPKLVFVSPEGMKLNHRHFHSSTWAPIRRAAGAGSLHFHDLRHAQATLLARAGVHPRIAQQRLGHANAKTTLEIYTHTAAEDQAVGAEAIEALLKSI